MKKRKKEEKVEGFESSNVIKTRGAVWPAGLDRSNHER